MKGNNGRIIVGIAVALLIMSLASVGYSQLTSDQIAAANSGLAPKLATNQVPTFGTWYSWQRLWEGPFPYNPSPELDCYDLGDGCLLFDDRAVVYGDPQTENGPSSSNEESVDGESVAGAVYGCGLWLDIGLRTNNAVLLTIHNTRPGAGYLIWSSTNLSTTNWVVETNMAGATGDFTPTPIAIGGRSNVFFRASEFRDYSLDTNLTFTGLTYADSGLEVPDGIAAAGPNHIIEVVNGTLAVYGKETGTLVAETNTPGFFSISKGGTNYPTGGRAQDARILFDRQSQRWIASANDAFGSSELILVVSTNDSPTNLATGWIRFLVPVTRDNLGSDFPTLGVDANGIYLSALLYYKSNNTSASYTLMAIKKPEVYQGILVTNRFDVTNDPPVWPIQPAVNFDDTPTNGYAWFVAKAPADLGTDYHGGPLCYRRFHWTGTNTSLLDTNWLFVTNATTPYRDYYDLTSTNIIYAPAGPAAAIDLHRGGSQLSMTSIRNGFLWTCHVIGLSGTNGVYTGNQYGTNVDRSAIQWLKLSVDVGGGVLNYSAHGRVYDSLRTTNAFYYSYPSLMVNCAGDLVLGFSGSSATNYIGAYYAWRLSNGVELSVPRLIRAGTAPFYAGPWGDYSATTQDPTDDWSFWTVQEYADPPGASTPWATVIARIRPQH
jgi:hypothetical protein